MDTCRDYDILWIQSIPSIAAIYYNRELSNTHVLYCPDDGNTPQQPRHIAKSILKVIDSNDKKLAVYFINPCTEKRRETIYKFLLKSRPDISSFCISIPTTVFQTNLLLGWSAGINDPLWQKRCAIELDPEAFTLFTPSTQKNGYNECGDYSEEFAISTKRFSKKSFIVDLTNDMISFDIHQGINFNYHVDHSIKGWMAAAGSTPRTMIWIIDEKSLFGEHINNVIQDKRSSLLKKYREKLFSSIEAFATTIPIYCYLVNFYTTYSFNLANYIAQIQHRHHLCLSKTILLRRYQNENFSQSYLSKMKMVYLNEFPIYNESKWESIYLKYFSEMKNSGYDEMNYISSDSLNVEDTIENYITPLLKDDREEGMLTITESIGNDDNLHSVSAKSSNVFNEWIKVVTEVSATYKDANNTSESKTALIDKILASLSIQKIKDFINDDRRYEQGAATIPALFDTQYALLRNRKLSLLANAKGPSDTTFIIAIEFDYLADIMDASCSCLMGEFGHCKHCAATLTYFLENPQEFKLMESTEHNSQESSKSSSDSSTTFKKRSFKESQDEDTTDTEGDGKKKNKSSINNSLDTTQDDGPKKLRETTLTVQSSIKQIYSTAPVGSNTSSSVENNDHSFSSTSLPSIQSSIYCSASSKSLSSNLSFPTIPSSGSIEANNSGTSEKESSYNPSSENAVLSYSSTEGLSQTHEQSANDAGASEDNSRGRRKDYFVTAQDATQYYNPNDRENVEEGATQYYNPNDREHVEDEATQYYNPNEAAIDLDDSEDEDTAQPYNADTTPTQYYKPETLSNSPHKLDEDLTQPYDAETAPTQQYNPEEGDGHADDTLSAFREGEDATAFEFDVAQGDDEWDNSQPDSPSESGSARDWLNDLI